MNLKIKSALLASFSLVLGSALFADTSSTPSSSSTDHAADADNSAHNDRDRNGANPTPLSQGKSASDLATTKQIRQQVVADKSLSVDAHNVKIITQNGHVTLRGPVKSADEKTAIGAIANGVATAANVDNQLEVKTAASGM